MAALLLSRDTSTKLLVTGIAALICSAAFAWYAAASEMSGKAVFHHSYGRVIVGDPVTRQHSPAKFREATNYKWASCILCAGGAAAALTFRRRLDITDLEV